MTARLRPFNYGMEFADWENRNCGRCANSGQDFGPPIGTGEYTWGTCLMEDALTEACIGDGTVDAKLGSEFGFIGAKTPHTCRKFRSEA